MCQQTIVLAAGGRITGRVVSWEGDGHAIVRVGRHDYFGKRAELSREGSSDTAGHRKYNPARSAVRRQRKVGGGL